MGQGCGQLLAPAFTGRALQIGNEAVAVLETHAVEINTLCPQAVAETRCSHQVRIRCISCKYIQIKIITVQVVVPADIAADTSSAGLAEGFAVSDAATQVVEIVINTLAIGT